MQSFFTDPAVVSSLSRGLSSGAWTPLGMAEGLSSLLEGTRSHLPDDTGSRWNVFDVLKLVCVFDIDKPVLSVHVEPVPCTKVSMELFDPIYSCGVLRPSGRVVECFHDSYPCYDKLRQVSLSFLIRRFDSSSSKRNHSNASPFVPDVAGGGVGALQRVRDRGARRVSVPPLQAPVFRGRALPVRRQRRALRRHHEANLQRPDQVGFI